jgi:hypothetical protein
VGKPKIIDGKSQPNCGNEKLLNNHYAEDEMDEIENLPLAGLRLYF